MVISDDVRGPSDAASVFVDNAAVRIHALDNGRTDAPAAPVLVVPGIGEPAEEYAWLLDRLGERRAVIVDVRGRGRSDAPETGYTWEDHIGDLRAATDALDVERPVVVAFSRGSSYALGYALQAPERVRGLVVGDYLARHAGFPEAMADRLLQMEIRGTTLAERMNERVVRRLFAESREVPLWDRLTELHCPVLVMRGDRRSTVVTDEVAERWRAALPSVEIATIPGAGHDLWSRDTDAYLAVLTGFLERIPAS